MTRHLKFAVFVVLYSLQSVRSAEGPALLPVPPEDQLKSGIEKVKQLYVAEYQRVEGKVNPTTIQSERNSLARKLLKTAIETPPNSAGYYPMLAESIRLAILANKGEVAFEAISKLSQTHAVNTAALHLEVFEHFAAKDQSLSEVRTASKLLLKAIQDAADAQRLDTAMAMVDAGEKIAKRILDQNLSKALVQARELLAILIRQESQVAAARKKIEEMPDDSSANLTLAKFIGLRKGEWESAELYAARVDEETVRSLFVRESALPQDPTEILRLANDWWEFGETQSGAEKLQAHELAAVRYESILGKLAGIEKIEVETRLATVNGKHVISVRLPKANELKSAKSTGDQALTPSVTTKTIASKTTGMKLALIPKGEFLMGSSDADVQAYLNADARSRDPGERAWMKTEQPQHRVQISQFHMGVYEVTQADYERVMGRNPSYFSKGGDGRDIISSLDTQRFPVEQVSFLDAIEFCNTLSTMDGLSTYYARLTNVRRENGSIKSATVSIAGGNGYRLPTEAEWEYACRATTTTAFHFGDVLNGDKANVNGNFPYGTATKGKYLGRPTTVGSYPPNKFGLFDMHANVWEWCWDSFDGGAYGKRNGTTIDPEVTGTSSHALRGNAWENHARHTRSASRGVNTADHKSYVGGFRVAR